MFRGKPVNREVEEGKGEDQGELPNFGGNIEQVIEENKQLDGAQLTEEIHPQANEVARVSF